MQLEVDYLVIGSGAMGMAFTDVLVTETKATVALIDRHHQPGGHWNDAYPYVRLHQPSAFYGVNSRPLGNDSIDTSGWNKGLYELATNSEVVAYFDAVMNQQFLPTGRVSYFPSCEYTGNGKFRSLLSGVQYQAKAGKIVDATYMNVTVPAIQPPAYEVSSSAQCIPPNELPKQGANAYVVIGGGKTGMDACLFLLKNDVAPEKIRWIMPRDSWILDRAHIQPGDQFKESIGQLATQQAKDLAAAKTVDDLFQRAEQSGNLLRLDPSVQPTMFRCATVTQAELEQLRRIDGIIRMGRVQRIDETTIHLDTGSIETTPDTVHVDCSADGLACRPSVPVFSEETITLQSVRTCQQVFSAAFIAHVEAAYTGETEKNKLCTPVPHPDTDIDFIRTNLADHWNRTRWAQDADLSNWLKRSRLDGFSETDESQAPLSIEMQAELQAILEIMQQAAVNAQRLLATDDSTRSS